MTNLQIISLGCARNDVDAEELAARLVADDFCLVDNAEAAEVVLVNTCGFIEAAKAEAIEEILCAAEADSTGRRKPVIVTGCLAERYGAELAGSLTEAAAIIGFDGYTEIASRVRAVLAGSKAVAHTPTDRRLLPLKPSRPWRPEHRRRLDINPTASLKIASGCDRRCAFCAIPAIRGLFESRPVADIVEEAAWLATQGVRELFLVSENTTSYGKDLDRVSLETLLAQLSRLDGIDWIRLSYLQPAEIRPGLIDAMADIDKVVPYFDLPFQHASKSVLKRMRRFGDAESYLGLLEQIRDVLPTAGIRSNVIVGFPGETADDMECLRQFLGAANLDAVGVFAYSGEEGTEGVSLPGQLDPDEITARQGDLLEFVDTVTALRAQDRIGEKVQVLIESDQNGVYLGRASQQGPEDAHCEWHNSPANQAWIGQICEGVVVDTDGVDWLVDPVADSE
ncbi:MAG: 30S ribosomal protein S12 methylthiotransferase RimO [Propionibacteriaceae bacterium]|jgi:ribosomal protein S12 methylthiotransferase RimO|nr:30S ribosomal protein S12 methylthiotransferase RimO [Propionibacteriaceae bacterium]